MIDNCSNNNLIEVDFGYMDWDHTNMKIEVFRNLETVYCEICQDVKGNQQYYAVVSSTCTNGVIKNMTWCMDCVMPHIDMAMTFGDINRDQINIKIDALRNLKWAMRCEVCQKSIINKQYYFVVSVICMDGTTKSKNCCMKCASTHIARSMVISL